MKFQPLREVLAIFLTGLALGFVLGVVAVKLL